MYINPKKKIYLLAAVIFKYIYSCHLDRKGCPMLLCKTTVWYAMSQEKSVFIDFLKYLSLIFSSFSSYALFTNSWIYQCLCANNWCKYYSLYLMCWQALHLDIIVQVGVVCLCSLPETLNAGKCWFCFSLKICNS